MPNEISLVNSSTICKGSGMKKRSFWLQCIEKYWNRSILWISGVRRVGKTCLCQTMADIHYFDCELPRVRRMMEDPEDFWSGLRRQRVVLDEIHRLGNPSEMLKIAADHYPDIRVIATGSSRLGASAKFKDTLSGRKTDFWLTPMMSADLRDFGNDNISHRLLRGGMPPFFMEDKLPERDFQEWMDAFWAKDIQELFRLERRYSFQKFIELLLLSSGGIFEATRFAKPCEVSRTTISNYLSVLEETYVVQVIRPFSTHRPTEIVAAPKIYGFDTGFVCYFKGWDSLRKEDYGLLWEHYVLNEINARFQTRRINYWRDKRGHEVDFVLKPRSRPPVAIECKWSASGLNPTGMQAFRKQYPKGENFIVAHDVTRSYSKSFGQLRVKAVNLAGLISELAKKWP